MTEFQQILPEISPKENEIISTIAQEPKNKSGNINIKSISLIKIKETEDVKFLGKKSKLFKKTIKRKDNNKSQTKHKNKKKLSITKQEEFAINKTETDIKINNDNPFCIICFDKINFQDKHYLHCGHVYHCLCINKWLDLGHDECPTCKQDIDCDKDSSDTISLDEDDENNYQININENNDNRLRNDNRVIITGSNKKEILLIFIIYILLVTFFMLSLTIENKDIPITVF